MTPTGTPARTNRVRTGPRGGPPVVLLHSAGLDLSYWDAQIAAWGDAHDVVAVDLPGHGLSAGTAADWTLAGVTAWAAAVVAGTGSPAAHLVGLSVGGVVAQALALARPALVRSLTLLDTGARFSDPGRAAMRERARTAREHGMGAVLDSLFGHWFTAATKARRPDLLDRATKTLLRDDPLVHAALWEMLVSVDLLGDLPRITCPTLVLVGEHDASSPVSTAEALRDGIPGARLSVVPDAAHLSPLERPDVVNERVGTFLATLDR